METLTQIGGFYWPQIFSLWSHEDFPQGYSRSMALADALCYLGNKAANAPRPDWVRHEVLGYIALGLGLDNDSGESFDDSFSEWKTDYETGNTIWWESQMPSWKPLRRPA